MRFMRFAVIFMGIVLCQACASDEQQGRPSDTAAPSKRASAAATTQRQGTTDMQILLDKIKADKKLLVASNMDLSDAESAKFWPLYEEYQRELDLINQRLAGTITDYADAYRQGPISDETAAKLLDEALAVEESEVALKHSYAVKFTEVLPAAKAARYLQIETKIRSLLRLDLAQNIPLVS